MTTNAIDKVRLIVASDSRWSMAVDDEHVLVADDTGFHKLAVRAGGSMVCAGDLLLIEQWMRWYSQPSLIWANRPPLNRDQNGELQHVVFHLVTNRGEIRDPGIGYTVDYNDEARFVGTGRHLAFHCYATNKCVKTSITTASKDDACTGGTVLAVDLRTGASNLTAVTATAQDVASHLYTRGTIVNKKTMQVTSLNDYATKRFGATGANLKLSDLPISAPTGTDAFVWNPEQEEELRKAFEMISLNEVPSSND